MREASPGSFSRSTLLYIFRTDATKVGDIMNSFQVGQKVKATRQITEAGGLVVGSKDAKFPAPDYIHAETGDVGTIEHVNGDGAPTVMFERTRTATIVSSHEII